MPLKDANVVLLGGPATHFPDEERIRYVPDTDAPLKLQRGNRYEHFEPTAEKIHHGGRELQVFCWTRFTYLAE